MQETLTLAYHNGVRRTALRSASCQRDEEWSPRETLLFVALTSAAGWAAALYPIVIR